MVLAITAPAFSLSDYRAVCDASADICSWGMEGVRRKWTGRIRKAGIIYRRPSLPFSLSSSQCFQGTNICSYNSVCCSRANIQECSRGWCLYYSTTHIDSSWVLLACQLKL